MLGIRTRLRRHLAVCRQVTLEELETRNVLAAPILGNPVTPSLSMLTTNPTQPALLGNAVPGTTGTGTTGPSAMQIGPTANNSGTAPPTTTTQITTPNAATSNQQASSPQAGVDAGGIGTSQNVNANGTGSTTQGSTGTANAPGGPNTTDALGRPATITLTQPIFLPQQQDQLGFQPMQPALAPDTAALSPAQFAVRGNPILSVPDSPLQSLSHSGVTTPVIGGVGEEEVVQRNGQPGDLGSPRRGGAVDGDATNQQRRLDGQVPQDQRALPDGSPRTEATSVPLVPVAVDPAWEAAARATFAAGDVLGSMPAAPRAPEPPSGMNALLGGTALVTGLALRAARDGQERQRRRWWLEH